MSKFVVRVTAVVLITPQPHRMCQCIMHHAPAHVWGWTPSAIMAHMHFSVNTTMDICETHSWCAVTLACVCAGARGVALGLLKHDVHSVVTGEPTNIFLAPTFVSLRYALEFTLPPATHKGRQGKSSRNTPARDENFKVDTAVAILSDSVQARTSQWMQRRVVLFACIRDKASPKDLVSWAGPPRGQIRTKSHCSFAMFISLTVYNASHDSLTQSHATGGRFHTQTSHQPMDKETPRDRRPVGLLPTEHVPTPHETQRPSHTRQARHIQYKSASHDPITKQNNLE